MSADRPATQFWARAEEERRALLAASTARFRRQMLEAGGILLADLSPKAQRTLTWLAEADDSTAAGVAELMTAARLAGRSEAQSIRALRECLPCCDLGVHRREVGYPFVARLRLHWWPDHFQWWGW